METRNGFTKMTLAEFEKWITNLRVGRTVLIVQQHHTFNPAYASFNGNNHFAMQTGMRNYHINHNGWADIGQHFTSFPDGTILTGRSMEKSPACLYGANTHAICLEHVGNFDKGGDKMLDEHKETIVGMTACLCKKFNIPIDVQRIVYHHWYHLSTGERNNGTRGNKSCPGSNFFGGNKVAHCEANFLPLVKQAMDGEVNSVDEITSNILKYVVVNTASLNVRKKADSSSDKVTDRAPVLLGAILRVHKEKNGWLKISDSKQHWVSGRFTMDVQRATVSATALNVRSTPEVVRGNVVASLTQGQEVFIETETNGWCKLVMENRWVSKDFLVFST